MLRRLDDREKNHRIMVLHSVWEGPLQSSLSFCGRVDDDHDPSTKRQPGLPSIVALFLPTMRESCDSISFGGTGDAFGLDRRRADSNSGDDPVQAEAWQSGAGSTHLWDGYEEEEGALKRKKGWKGKGKEEREIGGLAACCWAQHWSCSLLLWLCTHHFPLSFFCFPMWASLQRAKHNVVGPSQLESEEILEPSWNHLGRGRIQCMVLALNIQCVYIITRTNFFFSSPYKRAQLWLILIVSSPHVSSNHSLLVWIMIENMHFWNCKTFEDKKKIKG